MAEESTDSPVKVRAKSPGKYPILVLEFSPGELRTAYYETSYAPELTKSVSEEWLKDNAIGRHSFDEVEPPKEIPAEELEDYVRREVLEEL